MAREKHPLLYYIQNSHIPNNPKSIIKDRLLLMLYITLIYLFLSLVLVGCPLKFTTGISCPGCGMTRALYSLGHLDFNLALHYHPLFMLVPLMAILYIFDFYINPRLVTILWAFIITAFLATYFIRLFITHSAVVEIDISSGIMLKLYQFIIGGR